MPKSSDNKQTQSERTIISKGFLEKIICKFLNYFKSRDIREKPGQTEPTDDYENDALEGETIDNVSKFYKSVVEDVMIPRSDIVAVKSDIELNSLTKVMIENGHTRVLVYKENLDHIIGFIHIKDLFTIVAEGKKFSLKSILRKPVITTYAMKIADLLAEMKNKRTHIAVVVDEYGGTDGLVTIENIMEELFGEIKDEHDDELHQSDLRILDNGVILCNARVEVEDFEKFAGVKLKKLDDEFETIGGLVLAKVGDVPKNGDVIEIAKGVRAEIVDATPRVINQLRIILGDAKKDLSKKSSS